MGEYDTDSRRADPSELTTAALLREINNLEKLTNVRLNAMDTAIELTQKYPTLVDRASAEIKELIESSMKALEAVITERFKRIDTQISERDARAEAIQRDNKVAVDAAFAAANRTIDQLGVVLDTKATGLTGNIDDLKQRVTRIESVKVGTTEQRGRSDYWIVAAIGAVGVVIAVIVALLP